MKTFFLKIFSIISLSHIKLFTNMLYIDHFVLIRNFIYVPLFFQVYMCTTNCKYFCSYINKCMNVRLSVCKRLYKFHLFYLTLCLKNSYNIMLFFFFVVLLILIFWDNIYEENATTTTIITREN